MSETQLDRKDLKILAYKERVAELQEANADLRVDLTIYSQEVQRLQQLLGETGVEVKEDHDPAADED